MSKNQHGLWINGDPALFFMDWPRSRRAQPLAFRFHNGFPYVMESDGKHGSILGIELFAACFDPEECTCIRDVPDEVEKYVVPIDLRMWELLVEDMRSAWVALKLYVDSKPEHERQTIWRTLDRYDWDVERHIDQIADWCERECSAYLKHQGNPCDERIGFIYTLEANSVALLLGWAAGTLMPSVDSGQASYEQDGYVLPQVEDLVGDKLFNYIVPDRPYMRSYGTLAAAIAWNEQYASNTVGSSSGGEW